MTAFNLYITLNLSINCFDNGLIGATNESPDVKTSGLFVLERLAQVSCDQTRKNKKRPDYIGTGLLDFEGYKISEPCKPILFGRSERKIKNKRPVYGFPCPTVLLTSLDFFSSVFLCSAAFLFLSALSFLLK